VKLHQHLVASLAVSSIVYLATSSKTIAVTSFVTGVFLDMDHLTDYWVEHPYSFAVKHFFETLERCKLSKNYLWFHSIELLVPIIFIACIARDAKMIGISIGFAQHIFFDSIFNFIYPTSYFLSYRASKKFISSQIFDNTGR
jgi:hypothetical protein